MRVALCLSGQPRNVYRGIQNITDNMKFDFEVFVHAWWDSDSNENTFKKILYDGKEDEVSELMNNDWMGKLYENFNINNNQRFIPRIYLYKEGILRGVTMEAT